MCWSFSLSNLPSIRSRFGVRVLFGFVQALSRERFHSEEPLLGISNHTDFWLLFTTAGTEGLFYNIIPKEQSTLSYKASYGSRNWIFCFALYPIFAVLFRHFFSPSLHSLTLSLPSLLLACCSNLFFYFVTSLSSIASLTI